MITKVVITEVVITEVEMESEIGCREERRLIRLHTLYLALIYTIRMYTNRLILHLEVFQSIFFRTTTLASEFSMVRTL